jgi:hypothetical protein
VIRVVIELVVERARLEAVVLLHRNHVHDARDGVSAVQRRAAVQHRFEPFERKFWNDRTCGRGIDDATTVEQRQRAAGAKAPNIEARRYRVLLTILRTEHVRHHVGVLREGEVTDEGAHAGRARLGDCGSIDDSRRGRGIERIAFDV